MIALEVGKHSTLTHSVQEQDCAFHWGNDVPVLATPVLLWLAEIASMQVIETDLASGEMTVGIAHEARHLAPTPLGSKVQMHAQLIDQQGKRLRFRVEARDNEELIYQGLHERALVTRERFLQRVALKQATVQKEDL